MYGEKSVKLTRQELYEEVWADPVSKVAMKYGISDVGLAKICKRKSIPRPPLGYWTKLAHGHDAEKPQLNQIERAMDLVLKLLALQTRWKLYFDASQK